jgi:hypothetical protein
MCDSRGRNIPIFEFRLPLETRYEPKTQRSSSQV